MEIKNDTDATFFLGRIVAFKTDLYAFGSGEPATLLTIPTTVPTTYIAGGIFPQPESVRAWSYSSHLEPDARVYFGFVDLSKPRPRNEQVYSRLVNEGLIKENDWPKVWPSTPQLTFLEKLSSEKISSPTALTQESITMEAGNANNTYGIESDGFIQMRLATISEIKAIAKAITDGHARIASQAFADTISESLPKGTSSPSTPALLVTPTHPSSALH